MAASLAPIDAANLAQRVYLLRTTAFDDVMQTEKKLGCPAGFSPLADAQLDGTVSTQVAGMRSRRIPSRFGYVARGGDNEAIVVLRGTDTSTDWLANTNVTLARGPSGHSVHMGFLQTFESLRDGILDGIGDAKTVHCVGHSLGGALATVTADYLSVKRSREVKLYTFGAPRSGALGQPRHLTGKPNVTGIHRIFHTADPVPMLPIFPFGHVPSNGPGYAIPWPGTAFGIAPHKMEGYIRDIGTKSWPGLANLGRAPSLQEAIEPWLQAVGEGRAVRYLGTTALSMIRRGIEWLVIKVIFGGISLAAAVGMTALDRLAWILSTGAAKVVQAGVWTANLLTAILRWVGRAVHGAVDVTFAFVRWVLEIFFSTISNVAMRALSTLV